MSIKNVNVTGPDVPTPEKVADNEPKRSSETVKIEFPDVIPPQDVEAEDVPTPKAEIVDETDEAALLEPENPLKLSKAIYINDKLRNEFAWTDEISVEQFMEADERSHKKRTAVNVTELDNMFNFWLGVQMIVAANPEIDPRDMEQVKGVLDIMRIMRLGRFFTNKFED